MLLPAAVALHLAAAPAAAASAPALLERVGFVTGVEATTVALALSREARFAASPGEPLEDGAVRVVLVLERTRLPKGLPRELRPSDGRVRSISLSRSRGRVRATLVLEPGATFEAAPGPRPETIVVTVRGAVKRARASSPPGRLSRLMSVSGQLRAEGAYSVRRPSGWSELKSTLLLTAAGRLAPRLSYKVSGRGFYDSVFALSRRYPSSLRGEQGAEAELREAYVDLSAGAFDLRLGRQQVVWGEAVGLFVADVVNARDLREFILQDFEQLRIPQWGGTLEFTAGDSHLEAVVIPYLEFDRLPTAGSEFFPAPPALPGTVIEVGGARRPPNTWRNLEFGGRASQLVGGWDVSGFYWRSWDLTPALPRRLASPGPPALVLVEPEHKRMDTAGGSFSKDLGPAVLKGEAAYKRRKPFVDLDPWSPDGVLRRDLLEALLGTDFTVGERLTVNLQVVERRLLGFKDTLFRERKSRTWGTAFLKLGLWGNRLEPEVLVVQGLGLPDLMVRPRVSLKLGGRTQLLAGADLFQGSPDEPFAGFREASRVYGEVRVLF